VRIGVALLAIAAIFQMFDGVQGVLTARCAASATPARP